MVKVQSVVRPVGGDARSRGGAAGAAGRLRAIGSVEVLEIVRSRLRLIGEPMRAQIMVLLDESGPATVQEIVDRLPAIVTRQNVSRHLCLLYEAGMLRRTREASSVRYELADWSSLWLLEQIVASVDEHLDAQRQTIADGARRLS
jgi:DNA-binding transcriptional ArsR family regulator